MINRKLFNLDTINRWSLNRVIKNETVAQHSYWVAFFTCCIVEELITEKNSQKNEIKLKCIRYALFHDLDEVFTGDVSHQLKYNENNGEEIKKLIDEYIESQILLNFPSNDSLDKMFKECLLETSNIVKNIVKIADWLSFLKYLKEEESYGNKNILEVRLYCEKGLTNQIQTLSNVLHTHFSSEEYDLEILQQIKYYV